MSICIGLYKPALLINKNWLHFRPNTIKNIKSYQIVKLLKRYSLAQISCISPSCISFLSLFEPLYKNITVKPRNICSLLLCQLKIFAISFWSVLERNIEHFQSFLNPFVPNAPFPYLLQNVRKPEGFLMFSGGRERVHWEQMG